MGTTALEKKIDNAMAEAAQNASLAKEKLRQIIKDHPLAYTAYTALSFLLSRELEYDKSLILLEKALVLDPKSTQTHFNVGYIHQQLGHLRKACDYYKNAFDLSNSQYLDAGLLQGLCAHHSEQLAKAKTCLKALLEHHPDEPRLLFALAQIHKDAGDLKSAHSLSLRLQVSIYKTPLAIQTLVRFFTTYDLPKWQQLDDKVQLQEAMKISLAKRPGLNNYYPETFVLPEHNSKFTEHCQALTTPHCWIVKPRTCSGGQATYLVNNRSKIDKDTYCIVQRYIDNPLLLDGHKFNLRLYLIITSISPLRTYLWHEGIAFISPEPFSLDEQGLKNTIAHVVNPLLARNHPKLNIEIKLEHDHKSNMRRFSTLKQQLSQRGLAIDTLEQHLIQLAKQVVLTAQDNNIITAQHTMRYDYPLKIIGLDVVVDHNLKPYFVKIERFPGLGEQAEDNISNRIKTLLLNDCAHLIITDTHKVSAKYWEQQYYADELLASKKFYPLTPNQNDIVAQLKKTALNLFDEGLAEVSVNYAKRSIEMAPNDASAYTLTGYLLSECQQPHASMIYLTEALKLSHDSADAWNNLGFAKQSLACYEKAKNCYEEALAREPENSVFVANMGFNLLARRQPQQALTYFYKALKLDPTSIDARRGIVIAYALNNELYHATKMFTAFRKKFDNDVYKRFVKPIWQGELLGRKRLLIHDVTNSGNGYGDIIQNMRFLTWVAQHVDTIYFETKPALARLFSYLPNIEKVISHGDPIPVFDYHVIHSDLIVLYLQQHKTIPNKCPYIQMPCILDAPLLTPPTHKSWKVGVVWAGHPGRRQDRQRSIDFPLLFPLFEMEHIQFYNLLKGDRAKELYDYHLEQILIDITPQLRDFAATAVMIEHLDLVIAVDTAVAHLAGALGKQCWLLLPYLPDWRWGYKSEITQWYPSIKIFRQQQPGNWQDVITSVKQQLTVDFAEF